MPPDTGTYRFIGFADDFMIVRVDHHNVLDATLPNEEVDQDARTADDVGTYFDGRPLVAGRWFQVEEGTPIDLKVLIGEGPGGTSGFLLLIQRKSDDSTNGQGDDSAKADLAIFQVREVPVPQTQMMGLIKKKIVFPLAPDQDNPQP
jgi:hypothetical protein